MGGPVGSGRNRFTPGSKPRSPPAAQTRAVTLIHPAALSLPQLGEPPFVLRDLRVLRDSTLRPFPAAPLPA